VKLTSPKELATRNLQNEDKYSTSIKASPPVCCCCRSRRRRRLMRVMYLFSVPFNVLDYMTSNYSKVNN
jgi:hypothetical protein